MKPTNRFPMPFHAAPPPPPAPHHSTLVVPRHDVQWARPIFRAPSLPTHPQLYREIPFTVLRLRQPATAAR